MAQHDGYQRLGAIHQRAVEYRDDHWAIEDTVLSMASGGTGHTKRKPPYRLRLHWLLPDWPWDVRERQKNRKIELRLNSPYGWVTLRVRLLSDDNEPIGKRARKIQICRAGKNIFGEENRTPVQGWVSHNYGYKTPALSFSVEIDSCLPITFISEWTLPG